MTANITHSERYIVTPEEGSVDDSVAHSWMNVSIAESCVVICAEPADTFNHNERDMEATVAHRISIADLKAFCQATLAEIEKYEALAVKPHCSDFGKPL